MTDPTTLTSTNPHIIHIETQLSQIEDKKAAAQRIVQFNMDLQSSTLVNRTLQGRDGKGLEVTNEQLALMEELGLSARIVANFTKDSLEKLNSRAIRAQVEVAQATADQTQLLMKLGAATQQSQTIQSASVASSVPPAAPTIWMLNAERVPVVFDAAQANHTTLVNTGEKWITAGEAGLVPVPPPAPPADDSEA